MGVSKQNSNCVFLGNHWSQAAEFSPWGSFPASPLPTPLHTLGRNDLYFLTTPGIFPKHKSLHCSIWITPVALRTASLLPLFSAYRVLRNAFLVARFSIFSHYLLITFPLRPHCWSIHSFIQLVCALWVSGRPWPWEVKYSMASSISRRGPSSVGLTHCLGTWADCILQ